MTLTAAAGQDGRGKCVRLRRMNALHLPVSMESVKISWQTITVTASQDIKEKTVRKRWTTAWSSAASMEEDVRKLWELIAVPVLLASKGNAVSEYNFQVLAHFHSCFWWFICHQLTFWRMFLRL